ncbi:MAG: hypothetical protein ACE5MI_08835 [Acidimicrobiia bacterium]
MLGRLSHQTVRTVDLLVAVWVVVCILLGYFVAQRVNELGSLGDGLVSVGTAISEVAAGLGNVADIPFVGGGLETVIEQIDGIGQAAVDRGEEGKSAVLRLAVGIGLLFTLVPTLPVLVVWVPLRTLWERDRREIRLALESDTDGIEAYLAYRVVATYPYRRLHQVSQDPWSDLQAERFEHLAGLELERMGLSGRPS